MVAPVVTLCGSFASGRLVAEPPEGSVAFRRNFPTRNRCSFARVARCTWRFFETFVGPDRQLPPAGQLSGRSAARCLVDLPPRRTSALGSSPTLPPYDFGYITVGDPDPRRPRGPSRRSKAPCRSGTPFQLVRHAHAPTARAALRLHRRQRQPRRAPAHVARRGSTRWRNTGSFAPQLFQD